MRGWIIRWILCVVAMLLTAVIIPGFKPTVWAVVVGSVFLGMINAAIRPLLLLIHQFQPLKLLIAIVFINTVMICLTALTIRGFDFQGVIWGLLAVLLFSAISFAINFFLNDERKYWS